MVLIGMVVGYYTDDFAVEVEFGTDANQIANAHNCLNLGEFLPNIYHFRHLRVHRRSARRSNNHRFSDDPRKACLYLF